jgi:hypothetical protein
MKIRIISSDKAKKFIMSAFKHKFDGSKVTNVFMVTDPDGSLWYEGDVFKYRAHDGDYERLGTKRIKVEDVK